ncbi:MAG: sulfatase-like hydrolase/transferase [Candidatus Micrarchaeia archaeon]
MNISIIVMDSMRLDEFKKIDEKLAKMEDLGNYYFEDRCIAPASWTLPSHASIFTGMYPSSHGSHETKSIKSLDIEKIRLKKQTFLSDLKHYGYKTYGISANPYISPIYGFSEFDVFREESYFTDIFGSVIEISNRLKPYIAEYRNRYGNNIIKISKSIIAEKPDLFLEAVGSAFLHTPKSITKKAVAKIIEGWPIEKGGKNIVKNIKKMDFRDKYFLFVNLMEAHDPYIGKKNQDFNWSTSFLKEPPPEELVNKWRKLYSKAALKAYTYAYEISKALIDKYGDEQLIIITSDHGQLFGEHGFIGHGTVLYDDVVRVPLSIISGKKLARGSDYPSSLVNLKRFVMESVKGKLASLQSLHSQVVYSESFGIPANVKMVKGVDPKKLEKNDIYRKRSFSRRSF